MTRASAGRPAQLLTDSSAANVLALKHKALSLNMQNSYEQQL